ncbi:MAG TPA: hypothetical protein VKU87_04600 [Thermomicrobiaceae bacterium]|nr:hypothetical protein [Thermomicrobiaceae bacterium]
MARAIGAELSLILLAALCISCGGNKGSSSLNGSLAPSVDSSGVRIAISKAAQQGNQLWLTFRISSANPAKPNVWLIGGGDFEGLIPNLPEDVQYSGLRFNAQSGNRIAVEETRPPGTAPSKPPYPTPMIRAYDETVPLLVTSEPGAKLGVTIRKLRFDNANGGLGKVISGDWAFTFVLPNNLPTPTPTPTAPIK